MGNPSNGWQSVVVEVAPQVHLVELIEKEMMMNRTDERCVCGASWHKCRKYLEDLKLCCRECSHLFSGEEALMIMTTFMVEETIRTTAGIAEAREQIRENTQAIWRSRKGGHRRPV